MFRGTFFTILMMLAVGIVFGSEIFDMVENKTIPIETYMHVKSKKLDSNSFIVYPGTLNQNNLSTCKPLNKSEFGANFTFPPNTAIVLFSYGGCSHYDHVKQIKDVGGSIAILASIAPILDSTLKVDTEKLGIPILVTSFPDTITLLKIFGKNIAQGFQTRVNFTQHHNLNYALESGGFWIFLEIVLLLSYLFNYVLGIRSLILHFKKEGLKLSISQLTVWINLLATFIWAMAIFDPWNVRYFASQQYVLVIQCFITPSLLTSILLLSFFFNEVLIAKGFIKPQLTVLKYPFLILCLTFWGCYFANAYYFGSYLPNESIIKMLIFMNIFFYSFTGIYFLTVTLLVLAKLKTFNSPVIKRLIPLVSVILFGIVLFVSGSIVQSTQIYGTYGGREWFSSWTLMFSASFFILSPQFVYFREPYTSKTSAKPTKQITEKPSSNVNYEKQDSNSYNNLVDI